MSILGFKIDLIPMLVDCNCPVGLLTLLRSTFKPLLMALTGSSVSVVEFCCFF